MAFLSSFYPQPVAAGTTEGTFAEGNDSRIVGALPSATAGTGSVLASGSTTARTLASRFGEVFHVDDFGAVGDWNGTTGTDDTVAIQAAINAAVAAGGGIVRFGANKKYRLNTLTGRGGDTIGRNTAGTKHFLRVGSGNLTSNFGSTSMMLYFDGQGATLHATNYIEGGNDIIYTSCQFHTLVFSDLKFTRSSYQIQNTGNQTNGLSFYPADYNEHKQVLIQNCYFKDNLSSINVEVWNLDGRLVRGKLKKFDVINCIFEHDNGANRTAAQYSSGALCVNLNPWIDLANFDRCYADGQSNGQLSDTYTEAMHGFLCFMPIKANITNCYFTHFIVEVIKANDEEMAATGIAITGGFTQVDSAAPSNTLSATIALNSYFGSVAQTLVVGKIYGFFDPDVYRTKRGGYYRLEAKSGGGNYTFSVGESLNFTRIPSSVYQLPPIHEIQTGQTFGNSAIKVVDMELLERCYLNVSNCTFDSRPVKSHTGADVFVNSEAWDSPSILCDYTCSVVNNWFFGGSINFYSGVCLTNHLPTNIVGNTFYKYTDRATQTSDGYSAIFTRKGNILISSNSMIVRESRATVYLLFLGSNNIVVRNNTAIVLNPSASGSGGVMVATYFINYDNSGPWTIVVEDNYIKDFEHYGKAGTAPQVAHFTGSIRGTVAAAGSQPIRLAKQHKSPDGSTWTVGVTNDGELEVIK